MRDQEDYLSLLTRIIQSLNSSLDPTQVLSSAMDMVIEMMHAERGFIMLLENNELKFQVARNFDRKTLEGGKEISSTLVNRVVKEGTPVLTMDARMDDRFSSETSVIAYGLRSVLCVPLRVKERTIGVIFVDNRAKTGVFSPRDRDLLMTFANHAAVAIENARLYDSLKKSIDEKLALQQKVYEEEKARYALTQTNKLKEELVHYLVHDLRNPLTVVIGGLQILAKSILHELEGENADLLKAVTTNATSLFGMVNAILDVYKMEAGQMNAKTERLVLADLVRDVVKSSQGLLDSDVILSSSVSPSVILYADEGLILRVLQNLVGNAVKFTRKGVIQITAKQLENQEIIQASVIDTGPGIPPEFHAKIFDKFTQVEAKKTSGSRFSTGLGLTFCKLAVELMGGKIWVESQVDVGSAFQFTMPGKIEPGLSTNKRMM